MCWVCYLLENDVMRMKSYLNHIFVVDIRRPTLQFREAPSTNQRYSHVIIIWTNTILHLILLQYHYFACVVDCPFLLCWNLQWVAESVRISVNFCSMLEVIATPSGVSEPSIRRMFPNSFNQLIRKKATWINDIIYYEMFVRIEFEIVTVSVRFHF